MITRHSVSSIFDCMEYTKFLIPKSLVIGIVLT